MSTGAPRTRERQTRRTKRVLLAAADELFREGRVPTVAEVAERADVARATAYRYFPTQEALLLETSFLGESGPVGAPGALEALVAEIPDPGERIAEAVRRSAVWTIEREARLRAILRLSLESAETTRPARRRMYLATLLADVSPGLSETAYERLTGALTLLLGIDPIVSLRDNGDVPPERIPDVLAWAAATVVREALSGTAERG